MFQRGKGGDNMWSNHGRDYQEEAEGLDILNEVVNVVGIFLVSALWVTYLAYIFGPIIP